jgi:transcriptional regulator with XRE-family HTH domain
VSIAYGSGARHRPVDVSADDGEEVALDGTRLKQLRVERGLSVSDAARMVTLSREQVDQIENGGLRAFYGARHKLLAARKYAEGLGITLEEILPAEKTATPTPERSVAASKAAENAVVGNTESDNADPGTAKADIADVGNAVPASIATAEPEVVPVTTQQSLVETPAAVVIPTRSMDDPSPMSNLSQATVKRLPLALVVCVILVLVFSILRGLTPEPKLAELPPPEPVVQTASAGESPTSEPASETQAAATPEPESPAASAAPATPATAPATSAAPLASATVATAATDAAATAPSPDPAAEGACGLNAGPDTPRWAPPQARNASTRVFMTSASAIDVCVTDAAGVSTPLRLKPGAMVSASGKPPYIVRSDRLSQAQIFLQGLKVRVPASAVAVHLITTSSVRSPETPAPSEQ